jgi:hypothetical protein
MRQPDPAVCAFAIAVALLTSCKSSVQDSEKQAAATSASEEAASAGPPTAAVTQKTDDELCAWMCANCFREFAGLLEYPGDCRRVCIAQVTTKPCANELAAKVRCQVQNEDCRACDSEKQAALQCLRECAKLRRERGEETVPEHCKDKTTPPPT